MKQNEKKIGFLENKIKLAIAEQGINQADLAKKMGISKTQLNDWIKSQKMLTMRSLNKLSVALQKPISYFTDEQDNTNRTVRINSCEIDVLKGQMRILETKMDLLIQMMKGV